MAENGKRKKTRNRCTECKARKTSPEAQNRRNLRRTTNARSYLSSIFTNSTLCRGRVDKRHRGFMDLPPEIRCVIYKMCLAEQYCLESQDSPAFHEHQKSSQPLVDTDRPNNPKVAFGLVRCQNRLIETSHFCPKILRLSRQIYNEAMPVFVRNNSFIRISSNCKGLANNLRRHDFDVVSNSKKPINSNSKIPAWLSIEFDFFDFPQSVLPDGTQPVKRIGQETETFVVAENRVGDVSRWLQSLGGKVCMSYHTFRTYWPQGHGIGCPFPCERCHPKVFLTKLIKINGWREGSDPTPGPRASLAWQAWRVAVMQPLETAREVLLKCQVDVGEGSRCIERTKWRLAVDHFTSANVYLADFVRDFGVFSIRSEKENIRQCMLECAKGLILAHTRLGNPKAAFTYAGWFIDQLPSTFLHKERLRKLLQAQACHVAGDHLAAAQSFGPLVLTPVMPLAMLLQMPETKDFRSLLDICFPQWRRRHQGHAEFTALCHNARGFDPLMIKQHAGLLIVDTLTSTGTRRATLMFPPRQPGPDDILGLFLTPEDLGGLKEHQPHLRKVIARLTVRQVELMKQIGGTRTLGEICRAPESNFDFFGLMTIVEKLRFWALQGSLADMDQEGWAAKRGLGEVERARMVKSLRNAIENDGIWNYPAYFGFAGEFWERVEGKVEEETCTWVRPLRSRPLMYRRP